MLASSFNKGSFIANDRKLYDVEKEPELFFMEGIPHILKLRVQIKELKEIIKNK